MPGSKLYLEKTDKMSVLKELMKLLPLIHHLHYSWFLLSATLQLSLCWRPPGVEDFPAGGRIQPLLMICP